MAILNQQFNTDLTKHLVKAINIVNNNLDRIDWIHKLTYFVYYSLLKDKCTGNNIATPINNNPIIKSPPYPT